MNDLNRNLCRICLQPEDNLSFHQIHASNSKVAIQIYQISGVQVIESEDCPALICQQCLVDLQQAVLTRNKCLQADDYFRTFIPKDFFSESTFDNEEALQEVKCIIKDEPIEEYENMLNLEIDDIEQTYEESNYREPKKPRKPRNSSKFTKSQSTSSTSLKNERSQEYVDTSSFLDPDSIECPTCYKPFATIAYLKKHQRDQHSFRQKVSCSKCGKSLCDAYALVRHERRKHSGIEKPREKTLECDLCPYRTNTKDLLRRHLLGSHTTRERILCRICGKIVTNKANLKVHERIHFDVDPSDYVPCPVCQKTFKFKSLMVEHKKLVHDKSKLFQCPHCPHISSCKASYNKHFKSVHLQLRDFICSECGMGFSRNGELTRHMRVHTGERPYECKNCQKTFTQGSKLKRHERENCPNRSIA